MTITWVTVEEASDKTGYHPERVRELARSKKINAKKWGDGAWGKGEWRIDLESILQYQAEAKPGPKGERDD
jgi:hypothetical protein